MSDGQSTQAETLLAGFEASRRRSGKLSKGSIVTYHVYLGQFVEWLESRHPADITAREIDGDYFAAWYERYVEEHYGKEPSDNTIRNHHCALKSFYTWLENMDHVASNPMRKLTDSVPKAKRRRNDYLSDAEDARLLDAPVTPHERIIVNFLRLTGYRAVVDATNVRQRDVDLTPTPDYPFGRIVLHDSKTESGRRVLPIFPELLPELHRWFKYLDAHGLRNPGLPVLVTKGEKPMTHTFIWNVVKRVAYRADVRRKECSCKPVKGRHAKDCPWTVTGMNRSDVMPHTLRRTFGTSLRRDGVSIDAIKHALGHSDSRTTERSYVDLDQAQAAREILGRTA